MVDLHVPDVDHTFTYALPDTLPRSVSLGDRVLVPFGRRPRVEGYVVGFADASLSRPLRPVYALLDDEPILSEHAIAVARWMQQHYLCPLVQALQCFLPPGARLRSGRLARRQERKAYVLSRSAERSAGGAAPKRRAPRQEAILDYLRAKGGPVTFAELRARLNISRAPLAALLESGEIEETIVALERNPVRTSVRRRPPLALNPEQAAALEQIRRALDGGQEERVLIQGVTGSGKTEVYLQAIAHAREQGRGSILLVPEIALTAQTIRSLTEVFGPELAVLHSRLSLGERHDQWFKIRRGEARIVVGARSAVFAPVADLGLIVIDEEHETSYKQDEAPRYHAREVALARARAEGAVLVLGSATPALETRRAAELGEIRRIVLPRRIDDRPLPRVRIVDMREEILQGNRSMFSRDLQEALRSTLAAGEQALLFMNRRGFATFLLCRECGHVPRCSQCEVSLTFHQPDTLRCHYCDARASVPGACPECGGAYLRPFGAGTQRVQEEVGRLFPEARHVRMDVDTTGAKGSHERILNAFIRGEYNVLIGTQMIAKGLHLPGVTLVGVVSADTGLHFPEFRAAERTFQLLTQVAGRAGRGDRAGRVIVQTYAPEHYAVRTAAAHDYEGFYREESVYRRRAGYPPYRALVRCLWAGEDESAVIEAAHDGARALAALPEERRPEVVGPCPAPLARLKGNFRWHVLLKGERAQVAEAAARIRDEGSRWANVRLSVDVDPVSLL